MVLKDWLGSLLLLVSALSSTALGAKKPKDAVLLSDVKALTFRKDTLTTHRRVSAIPQVILPDFIATSLKHSSI